MPMRESERKRSALLVALSGYSVLPALGLACFRLPAWAMFRSEYGYLDSSVSLISHLIQALTIVLFLIAERKLFYTEQTLVRIAAASTALTFVGTVVFCFVPLSIVYAYAGSAITGAFSTVPLLVWGYYFCSVDPCKSAFQLTLAFAIYGCATATLSFLPASWAVPPMFVCPIVSLVCLWLSIARDNARVPAEPSLALSDLRRLPWGILAVLSVCMLSNVLAKCLVPVGDFSYVTAARMYWPVIFGSIFALVVLWVFVLKRSDPWRLWPVFAILIFCGLLCYATFSPLHPAFASTFFRAVQDCVMLFCWVIAASAAYRKSLPAIPVFGLMTLIFIKSPLFISVVAPSSVSSEMGASAIVVTAVMALVLIVLTIVISNLDSIERLKAGVTVVDGDGSGDVVTRASDAARAVAELGERFELTQREMEVARYLLNGYTMPQMAETLCVSIDTVRSHCKNLYRKTGVHKKQELVRLAERVRDGAEE